jgi:leader peptidase (prepilin peptidase)/N-methyltransferase
VNSLLGIFVGGGLFYLFAILGEVIFKRESLGGGDIKLALMLGAFLGWERILLVFFLAAILGSVIGILFMFLSQKIRKEKIIPFGPFLAVAAFLGILWGEKLIRFYLDTFLGL